MKRKYALLFLAIVMLFSFGLTACGGSEDKPAEEAGQEVADSPEEKPADDGEKEEEAKEPSEGEKIVRTNNFSEPGSLDPAQASGTHEGGILVHIFEGLMTYNENGELVSGVGDLDKVKISDDLLTYTFTIKDGIKWSNGDPVTAADFEFSWKRILDPEFAADYAFQLFYIEGGEEYNSVEKPGIYYEKDDEGNVVEKDGEKVVDHVVEYTDADLEGLDVDGKSEDEIAELVYQKWLQEAKDNVKVKAVDDNTLEVKLVSPTKYFVDLMAHYSYFPVCKNVVEANPDWANSTDTFVSNGPFLLKEWNHDQNVLLVKNPDWQYADKVKIDGINYDLLEDQNAAYQKYDGGDYDLLWDLPQTVVAKLNTDKNPELRIGNEMGTYYYNFNTTIKPFNNANVRKAFALALDRLTITEKVSQGGQIPATGMVPFGVYDEAGVDFREANGELIPLDYESNLAKAKELMEKGLAEEGMTKDDLNGKVLLYNTSEGHKKIAQVAQQMWKQAFDIEFGLENVDFNVKLSREKRQDYDISRAGWVGDYADPMTILDLFVTGGPFNDTLYSNPRYDELIMTAKNSGDQKLRMDSMKEAEKILMEDMPICPVYYYTMPYVQKPYLTGVYKPMLDRPIFTYSDIER
ncbi:MAG: peptide ABC transporter substrate-binding protein [Tissierellia bacterium]|nr:peptide ABC transporter substrate-binding protein [Tissierellia bacterium]